MLGLLLLTVVASCGGSSSESEQDAGGGQDVAGGPDADASSEHPVDNTDAVQLDQRSADVSDTWTELASGDGAMGSEVGIDSAGPGCGIINMGCFKGEPCNSERVMPVCVAGEWQCPAGSGPTEHCPPPDASAGIEVGN